MNGQIASANI